MEMSERKERLLAAIVERYVSTGEPVGSKLLSALPNIAVSSATVRNELAELTEMGYLEQPHTSAGRIPSGQGYRYYIDKLMNRYELPFAERAVIDARLRAGAGEPHRVLEQAGSILADMTNCAVVSTTPSDALAVIRRVELVPIGTRTAMIVLLTSSGILKSRVLRTDSEITLDLVEVFYNIVGKHFLGKPAAELSIAKMQTLAISLGEKTLAMTPLLVALSDLVTTAEQTEVLLEGQSNLLHHKEFESNAYELMEFLRRGEPIVTLFSAHKENGEDNMPNVLIGKENLFRELQNSSMIFGSYRVGGQSRGNLGIIGPTRIDYARLIPSLKYLTDIVGIILSDSMED